MIVILTTGYSYNLDIDDELQKLIANISNMRRREQLDRIHHIYLQVSVSQASYVPAKKYRHLLQTYWQSHRLSSQHLCLGLTSRLLGRQS